jgi:hypothetical protein
MKNMLFIIILLLLVGEAYAEENAAKITSETHTVIENVSPEALFDQIRGFLTIPVRIPSISAPALKMPDFDTSGIHDLNYQIREITGVDILRLLSFFWNIFLMIARYFLEFFSRTTG